LDGQWTDTCFSSTHTHGRRFAVTWMVTTECFHPGERGSSLPNRKELTRNHSHPIKALKHLPKMDRFLGEFSLLVQIEEKSPGDCVDGLIGTNCRGADYEMWLVFLFSKRVVAREFSSS